MYVRVINGVAERYTITDLKRANKNVSFPKELTDRTLAEFNIYNLVPTAPPVGDVVTESTPTYNNTTQQWEQTWSVRGFSTQELAEIQERRRAAMVITPRQARLALLRAGMLGTLKQAVASLDAATRATLEIEWEYASHIERNSPLMTQLSSLLGLNETQLDRFFEEAETL